MDFDDDTGGGRGGGATRAGETRRLHEKRLGKGCVDLWRWQLEAQATAATTAAAAAAAVAVVRDSKQRPMAG